MVIDMVVDCVGTQSITKPIRDISNVIGKYVRMPCNVWGHSLIYQLALGKKTDVFEQDV